VEKKARTFSSLLLLQHPLLLTTMARDFGPERLLSEEELIPNESVKAALTAPGNLSAFEIEEKVVDGKLIKTWKNLRPSMRAFWDFASQVSEH
jgi:hypothetical protein